VLADRGSIAVLRRMVTDPPGEIARLRSRRIVRGRRVMFRPMSMGHEAGVVAVIVVIVTVVA
jgi:hypothetical protein